MTSCLDDSSIEEIKKLMSQGRTVYDKHFYHMSWHENFNLQGVSFNDCVFENVRFSGDCVSSEFSNTVFSACTFDRSIWKNVNFDNCILMDCLFVMGQIDSLYFDEGKVINTVWRDCEVDDIYFSSILEDVEFTNCVLKTPHFNTLKVTGIKFIHSSLEQAILTDFDFKSIQIIDSEFICLYAMNCSAQGYDFSNMQLKDARFSEANLAGATFEGSNLEGSCFTESNLVGANFNRTDLSNALFINAALSNSQFIESNLDTTNFSGSIAEACVFDRSQMYMSDLTQGNFLKSSFIESSLNWTDFSYSNISDCRFDGAIIEEVEAHAAVDIAAKSFPKTGSIHRTDKDRLKAETWLKK